MCNLRKVRPQLQAALEYLRDGDLFMVHSMDRLARSLDDLRRIVRELTDKGVHVQFVKEGLTFTGEDKPMSQLLLSMLRAVAEFERSMICERQREGIELAKKKGVYKGRKPSLTATQVAEIRKRVKSGEKKARLAAEFRISRQTLYAALRLNLGNRRTGTYSKATPPRRRMARHTSDGAENS